MSSVGLLHAKPVAEQSLPLHEECTVFVHAPAERIYPYLDDPLSLASHMEQSSMMMLGSHMATQADAAGGRAVGSVIRMEGHVLGVRLTMEEVIMEREPPYKKTWQTIGSPQLLVIAQYRMGFELAPQDGLTRVRFFIDYRLPASGFEYGLGRLLGGVYARWCVQRMAADTSKHFNRDATT